MPAIRIASDAFARNQGRQGIKFPERLETAGFDQEAHEGTGGDVAFALVDPALDLKPSRRDDRLECRQVDGCGKRLGRGVHVLAQERERDAP